MNMRLAGQGDAGEKGGPNGHMYVQIRVEDDPYFTRKGPDVYVDVRVALCYQCFLVRVTFLIVYVVPGPHHHHTGHSGCLRLHSDTESESA